MPDKIIYSHSPGSTELRSTAKHWTPWHFRRRLTPAMEGGTTIGLTAVPEPGMVAALAGMVALAAVILRRRIARH